MAASFSLDMDFRGIPVTVMGLGHFGGGLGAARYLARRGAAVTVSDRGSAAELAEALAGLADVPLAGLHLNGHRETDFEHAGLILVNPAVRPGHPLLEVARGAGATLVTEIELFLEACPAPVVGVTGSNGKSTTAALLAAALSAAGRRVFLGGNLGGSLLEDLEAIDPRDCAVVELSSFQLHYLRPQARLPRLAVVTGCTANHLDWHGDWPSYVAAKQRLLAGQDAGCLAVFDPGDGELHRWRRLVRGEFLAPWPLHRLPPLRLPGEHNRRNAALAAAAAEAAGCGPDAIAAGLAAFAGLPQRLERLATVAGRLIVDDSAATTPHSTLAALAAVPSPRWLIAGGSDKQTPLGPLVSAIADRASGAAFFGAMGPRLGKMLAAVAPGLPAAVCTTLDEALDWCLRKSRPGETILFSPALASHDQFRNYRQRGKHFARLVASLRGPSARG